MSKRLYWPAAVLALLAGCSSKQVVQTTPPPRQTAPVQGSRPLPTPSLAAVQGTEAVWHLRAGLNVAALSCRGRGRVGLTGEYRQLLSRHDGLLDASYSGELRRYGQSGLDRHQTQLYNRFALQRSPARFCQAAQGVARRAVAMNATELTAGAPRLVAELESARR